MNGPGGGDADGPKCQRGLRGDGGTPVPCSGPSPRGSLAGGTSRTGRFHLPCLRKQVVGIMYCCKNFMAR